MVLKMKMIALNKHSSKFKICSVEIPNTSYSNRCAQAKELERTDIIMTNSYNLWSLQ